MKCFPLILEDKVYKQIEEHGESVTGLAEYLISKYIEENYSDDKESDEDVLMSLPTFESQVRYAAERCGGPTRPYHAYKFLLANGVYTTKESVYRVLNG